MIRKHFSRMAFSKSYKDPRTMADYDVNCLMLHPVGWPNKGPQLELNLAQEAIGLVHSLGWNPLTGPNKGTEDEKDEDDLNVDVSEATGRSAPRVFSKSDNRAQLKREGI